MLYIEDVEARRPAIWLQPGDLLTAFDQQKGSFNSWIEDWKGALLSVITNQVMQEVQPDFLRETLSPAINTANAALNFIKNKIDSLVTGGSTAIQQDVVALYMKNNFIRIYIDDLDRGWEAKQDDIKKIATLLNAIRDICGSTNSLQFRVALRTDVYYLVRTSDESTDKIEDKVVWLSWSNHEILILFAKRIETFLGNNVNDAELYSKKQPEIVKSFSHVMEPRFSGQGKWSDAPTHRVLMSLQRKRPRDLVKLLGGAAKAAYQNDHEIITTSDLRGTFSTYSAERLQDIVNEFSSEIPQLKRLLLAMKPNVTKPHKGPRKASESYLFSQSDLDTKVSNILSSNPVKFTNNSVVSARSIGQFLYKIDFVIARKDLESGKVDRKFFDQSRFLFDQNLDFGYSWEIHPAYRWALQPDNLDILFDQISIDEGD
ncbi:P-loop ATPase, Sll1717 family [Novosphingobium humi]|uniref:Uncharacterized protein n=1 Tax=Novosphingobium humi TaxID=2282397 RepID=A0ABY7TTN0_9SPHN|nr:hypothetical protein [Novosphingobium humi]WCT76582.1 hypothetical protein PQ457_11625 [Novosphingobium humi]